MKRVIITGATGFVGANLARRLLQEGHQVHLLVRPGYNPWRIEAIRKEVRLQEADFGDLSALTGIVGDIRPEWIFHLAVHGAYPWQTDTQRIIGTNILGTINLVEACLKTGFEALVNTGSSSEYGFKDHAPKEEEGLEPNSLYAATKASATLYCQYISKSREVHLPTLRLYSIYGPYEEPTRLMPQMILRGLEGGLPPLVNPQVARDYVYVEDVIDAYILAASRPNQERGAIYNIGTGIQTALSRVVEVARQVMAIKVEPQWGSMPNRSWDTNIWVADNRKSRRQLGWQPGYTFEKGFSLMVDWFHRHPHYVELYRKGSSPPK